MRERSKFPEAVPFRRGRAARPRRALIPEWITPDLFLSLGREGTNAHRLASADGLWIERFADDVLVSYQDERDREAVLAELDTRLAVYGFRARRVFGKFLPHQAAERGAPILLRGEENLSWQTEVTEAGVRYGLDFGAGYSAGLFLDQRNNRARVRQGNPRRLLNTFAYTCSFSVTGALAGAETLSVDLSRRSLARGEENFTRNGLDPKAGHRFIADDALAVMPRLARRGEKFDLIVLDPPTFSRNQAGGAFQVRRDFGRLVDLALDVAAPGARLLLSVNHSAMEIVDLERAARGALRVKARTGRFQRAEPLPDFPPGQGAKTIWLEV